MRETRPFLCEPTYCRRTTGLVALLSHRHVFAGRARLFMVELLYMNRWTRLLSIPASIIRLTVARAFRPSLVWHEPFAAKDVVFCFGLCATRFITYCIILGDRPCVISAIITCSHFESTYSTAPATPVMSCAC